MAEKLRVQRILNLDEDDLQTLCEVVDAAILDGEGFDWLQPQGRQVLERYFRGLLMVPERMLFAVRQDGVIMGGAQLVRSPRNNEMQAMCVTLAHLFVAPYAHRALLGATLLQEVESAARNMGFRVMNADVPETRTSAIALLQQAGFILWGSHPFYARVGDDILRGLFFTKPLDDTPPFRVDQLSSSASSSMQD